MSFRFTQPHRGTSASLALLAGFGAMALWLEFTTPTSPHSPEAPSQRTAQFASASPSAPAKGHSSRPASTTSVTNIKTRSVPNRRALLREGEELASRWPDSKEEALRRARELALQDPVAGLTLLSPLHLLNLEGVTTWERDIVREWARSDQAALLSSLQSFSRGDTYLPEYDHWLSLTASLVQHENRDGLRPLLQWVGEAEKSGDKSLPIQTVTKLVAHFTPDSFAAVSEYLLPRASDTFHRESLLNIANQQARQKPEETIAWVGRISDQELRMDAVQAVIGGITWQNPALVTEWINNGRLFGEGGVVGSLDEANRAVLRDNLLMTYFHSLISKDPSYVAKYADAVSDPAARQYLQKMARVIAETEMLSATEFRQADAGETADIQNLNSK